MKTKVQSFIRFGRITGALLLPLFLLIFIVLQAYGASGDQLWVRRYNGPTNGTDRATAIAVDARGNLYVTGISEGDYATIKYDSAGSKKWVRRYNGPGNRTDWANAIAVDTRGNVYVTGYSTGRGTSYDYATIKYDSAGNKKWVRRYNGPANDWDEATAIAVDASGNVYVTGRIDRSTTDFDYLTIKYDCAGKRKWARRYSGPGYDVDEPSAIAVDSQGNIYVTGYSEGPETDFDYATIKYDPAGNEKWVRRYNYRRANGTDRAYAIAVDTSDNIYVTGESQSRRTGYDYLTIKYSPAGKRKWVRRYNYRRANGTDWALAIALDARDNLYVTGSSDGHRTDADYATIKYSPAGRRKWVRRYNYRRANATDVGSAIAVDTKGNVYVTGYSYRSTTLFDADYLTIKYSQAGKRKWVRRYNGPADATDGASAIALDAGGNVYVTGSSVGSDTGPDYATIKYAP